MMYGWGDQGSNFGGWVVMAVAMLLFWAIVIFGIIAIVRYFGRGHVPAPGTGATSSSSGTAGTSTDPEEILRTRLARGEIGDEEFRKTLTALRER